MYTHRIYLLLIACLLLALPRPANATSVDDPETLELGAKAPDFNLQGTDDQFYTLDSFSDAQLLAIVFTCNHCPTAQAYEERIKQLVVDYEDKGVAIIAISPNDPKSVRLDELGYSDLNDSLEDMKIRAADMDFNFPYLYDGDTQEVSMAYGPVATPHVFIFDEERILRYTGRIDDKEKIGAATIHDTRDAIDALLADKPVAVEKTKTFGCSIKWADKSGSVQRAYERWAKEPVSVAKIDVAGVKDLMKNDTEDMLMINVWATWCGPCVSEFPELVDINRMYRQRDFQFITISMDSPDLHEDVGEFLKDQQASNTNYHFSEDDSYALIEAIDPEWAGALPYTVFVKPGGEIFYRQMGEIDPMELKRQIVDYVGRYYD
ncbi:MAG: redoxin domain-containing protein [Rhodothermaceae bacterium]|nr:redoxin domain-containing protein [Rhodothermaceae bacterium]